MTGAWRPLSWTEKPSNGSGGSSALESIDGNKITSDGFIMYYKKSGERELELFFLPNFSDSEMNISVEVSNSFECDTSTFKQSRCSGYEFESIIWRCEKAPS